jgi:DNA-binding transcriptional LysR family regulator
VKSSDNITFAQLRTFSLVAKSGSFARAAAELDISQPAVSEQVKILERKLDQELFIRRRGATPTLTEAGRSVLEEADTILAALGRLGNSDLDQTAFERLVVGVSSTLRETYLTKILPGFYRMHPGIELEIPANGSYNEQLAGIETGELDLAIFTLPREVMPNGARMLRYIPVVFVASPETCARLEASNFDYSQFDFALNIRNPSTQTWSLKFLEEAGIHPKTPPRFIEFKEVAVQLVEEDGLIGLFANHMISDWLESGALVPLDIPVEPWQRGILRSPQAPPVAKEFEDYICGSNP